MSSVPLTQIKEKIKEKLTELGAYVDEELPDYIMVMIANKKSKEQMTEDLSLFLNEDAGSFTEWLEDYLNNPKKYAATVAPKHRSSTHHKTAHRERSRSRSPLKRRSEAELDVKLAVDSNEFENTASHDKSKKKASVPVEPSSKSRVSSPPSRIPTLDSGYKKEKKSKEKPIPILSTISKPVRQQNITSRRENDSSLRSVGQMVRKAVLEARDSMKSSRNSSFENLISSQVNIVRPSDVVAEVASRRERHQVSYRDLDKEEYFMDEQPTETRRKVTDLRAKLRPKKRASSPMLEEMEMKLKNSYPTLAERLGVKKPSMMVSLTQNFSDNEENENSSEGTKFNKLGLTGDSQAKKPIPDHLERCKFWPHCRNKETCEFFHPSEECSQFPNCKNTATTCSFVHPTCKYDALCQRSDCKYQHSQPSTVGGLNPLTFMMAAAAQQNKFSSGFGNPTVCRFHPFCTNAQCAFLHPGVAKASVVATPCRYGLDCRNQAKCPFSHVPPPGKLKWTKPTVSATPGEQPGPGPNSEIQAN